MYTLQGTTLGKANIFKSAFKRGYIGFQQGSFYKSFHLSIMWPPKRHHVSTSKTKDRMLSGAMIFAFQAPAAVAMADLFAKEGELCCFCPFELETKNCSQNKKIARWFSLKYFFMFTPYPGVSWFPIWLYNIF